MSTRRKLTTRNLLIIRPLMSQTMVLVGLQHLVMLPLPHASLSLLCPMFSAIMTMYITLRFLDNVTRLAKHIAILWLCKWLRARSSHYRRIEEANQPVSFHDASAFLPDGTQPLCGPSLSLLRISMLTDSLTLCNWLSLTRTTKLFPRELPVRNLTG